MVSGASASGVIVPSINGSARKPSSVISLTKLLGVHSDCTPRRSTFGRKDTACVTSYSRFSAAAFQMSPRRALTTTFRRFAPSTSAR